MFIEWFDLVDISLNLLEVLALSVGGALLSGWLHNRRVKKLTDEIAVLEDSLSRVQENP